MTEALSKHHLNHHYIPTIAITITFLISIAFTPLGDQLNPLHMQGLKASVTSAQSNVGEGLKGEYFQMNAYAFPSWTTLVKTRIDPQINFRWGWSPPITGMEPDFSVRWSGQIFIEGGTGNYTFSLTHDDGARLFIDNKKIYEKWGCCAQDADSDEITLESGKRYDITLEFFDGLENGYIDLFWRGPGITKQIIPQRVLFSSRSQCSDSVDNDNDGKTDWKDDPGCDSAHDNDETDPACKDGIDNDNDNLIDYPDDPGCTNAEDTDETNAALAVCSDGKDNDGDGVIDYPDDPGCENKDDTDETDPPPPLVKRKILIEKNENPQTIMQALLNDREVLELTTQCISCTITASPDIGKMIGGTAETKNGFIVVVNMKDSSGKIYYTVINVGGHDKNTQIITNSGKEYLTSSLYPLGIEEGGNNDPYLKVGANSSQEKVRAKVVFLPKEKGDRQINTSVNDYLLKATDSKGKEHIVVVKGRYWDASRLVDSQVTEEPWYGYFSAGTSKTACVSEMKKRFSDNTFFLDNQSFFQEMLEALTLCKRETPGANIQTNTP